MPAHVLQGLMLPSCVLLLLLHSNCQSGETVFLCTHSLGLHSARMNLIQQEMTCQLSLGCHIRASGATCRHHNTNPCEVMLQMWLQFQHFVCNLHRMKLMALTGMSTVS